MLFKSHSEARKALEAPKDAETISDMFISRHLGRSPKSLVDMLNNSRTSHYFAIYCHSWSPMEGQNSLVKHVEAPTLEFLFSSASSAYFAKAIRSSSADGASKDGAEVLIASVDFDKSSRHVDKW